MLNGDAHYSTTREGELRIWAVAGFSKTRAPTAYQTAPALIIPYEVSYLMLIRIDEPAIPCQNADFTLLYVGRDVCWFGSLKDALSLPQYRVVYCPGGSSAELLLKSDVRYDLFVFDFDLPNETGLELIRLARSLSHREHTPIVIVANELTGNLKELARDAGAGECVAKTPDVLVVMETIQRRLAKARARRRYTAR